jgi:hypothetical protein
MVHLQSQPYSLVNDQPTVVQPQGLSLGWMEPIGLDGGFPETETVVVGITNGREILLETGAG